MSHVPPSPPTYVVDAGRDDEVSEGEITVSVSIQDILSKLDSVKASVLNILCRVGDFECN